MRIRISYLTVNLKFIKDYGCYGTWVPPHAEGIDDYGFDWGDPPLTNPNEGYILLKEGLEGPLLVDTIHHEVNHAGWWLYHPEEEESQVRVASSVWQEALTRNPNLKKLVLEHI